MVEQKTGCGGRIIPALRYRDAATAIDWLCTVFGFARKMVVPGEGGKIAHAELNLGNGMIMLGNVETEYGRLVAAPERGRPVTQGIYVVVDDVKTQDYGGRDYTARDLEGRVWTFGSYDPWA